MTEPVRTKHRWGLVLLVAAGTAWGQSAGLTVADAVKMAVGNYPAVRVSQEQMNAAGAGIRLARTAYLPRVDAVGQVNRATRNNVFGMLLPQTVVPSISGPVLHTNNLGTAWGSAVGMLVSWEPFDFGQRRTSVEAAAARRSQTEAAVRRTQFEVAVAAADAYLTLAAAMQTVRAAEAGVTRAEAVNRVTRAQVEAQLRPGADASRAEAETAAAKTQLIQAEQAVAVARATVAQFVGGEPEAIALRGNALAELPPDKSPRGTETSANPVALEQGAAVEQAKAQLRALARLYFPRFQLQASAYARGTGAEIDGRLLGGANGLAPSVQNYGLGFTVTFPVFELASIRARQEAQSAVVRSEAARGEQIAAELKARMNRAVAALEGARRVAENVPAQVTAARAAGQQATARYEAGLGNISEVADAQRLLTQAEIDEALARLGVWRGLLGVAAAAGDLDPFIAEASR